jgi:hypothetical protein
MLSFFFSSILSLNKFIPNRALFFTQGRKVKITANDLPLFTHGNFRKGFFVLFFLAILRDQKIGKFSTSFKKQQT